MVENGGLCVKHRGHYDTLKALIGFMATRAVTACVVNDGLLAGSVVLITDNEAWEC